MSVKAADVDNAISRDTGATPDEPVQSDFTAILANTVHDMKNSVGMVIGMLDEIDGSCGYDACPSHALFSQLRYEGKRLNSNLVQLLMLYRTSNSEYTLNVAEHDVYEVLEECFLEHRGVMSVKGIRLELSCDDDLMGFFDRELVISMINSVMNNAYKYAKDRIRIGAGRESGYLVFYVEENGKGYPEFMLRGCADAPHGVDVRKGSTGLGLLFASTIARMHSHRDRAGYITTTNDGIDGGGRFTLYLP